VSDDPSGDGSGIFSLDVPATNLPVLGRYLLRAGAAVSTMLPRPPQAADGTLVTEPEVTVVKRTLAYQTPVVLALGGLGQTDLPEQNQLGVVAGEVAGLGIGMDGAGTIKQKLRRFGWNGSALVERTISGFWTTQWGAEVRGAFAADNILLGQPALMPSKPALTACPLNATVIADCRAISPSTLPVDSQTLAVSSDGKWGAYAANDGALWSRDLSASGMWQALVTNAPTVKQVLGVWLVDVSGDGKTDVVGVWQDGQTMTARVFLGNGSAFAEEVKWSQAVTAIGPSPLSAMAMGDVDGDGYADVVVARGLTLTLQQNLFGTFAPVWKGELDPKQAGMKVSALAVGRVSGTDLKQSLDIVAASYTDYDALGKCSLYLQVFRPQPPTAQ